MAKKKDAPAEGAEEAKKGSKKGLIIGVVLMLVGVFAGKTFFGGGGEGTKTIAVPAPETTVLNREAAVAVPLEPVIVNLTDGAYLKMGLTITMGVAPAEAKLEDLKPKFDKIRDEALTFLSGRTSVDVLSPHFRDELKAHLMERSKLWYEEAVADIAVGDWVVS
jgi:flagellar FliL protein